MANISKQKQYAALWLHNTNKTLEEISQELELSVEQVEKIIEKNSSAINIKTTSQPVKASKIQDTMITESAAGKHRVAIMTKQASEISDEAIKKNNTHKKSSFKESCIFKPISE